MEKLKIATAQFENISGDKNYNLQIIDKLSAEAAKEGLKTEETTPAPEDLDVIRLDYVQFDQGGATLTKDARSQLVDLAEMLKKYPKLKIEIGVHTDNRGDAAANKALSQERADAALIFLRELGLDTTRVSAVGYGSEKPLDTNDTDAARQKNRRTEFRIIAQ